MDKNVKVYKSKAVDKITPIIIKLTPLEDGCSFTFVTVHLDKNQLNRIPLYRICFYLPVNYEIRVNSNGRIYPDKENR